MVEITIPEFTVRPSGPNRIRVDWSDATTKFHFLASFVCDEVTKIETGSLIGRRSAPTIFVSPLGNRGSTSYEDARAEKYAPVVTAISERIKNDKLVTKAFEEQADARRVREEEAVSAKAAKIVELMEKNGLVGVSPHHVDDGVLAAFYDDIQNSAT